ncbi:protein FAR1-RELATED SEQUENCE [Trifolium repens]|nr:protein FAR1-RELATED SEQUENCE [Trifolium repens]
MDDDTQSNNKICFDLNECPEDIIESSEKEIISSLNIVTNEEVDEDEIFNESNCVPFVGQIFPNEEEAFAFYKRYAYQQGFAVKKEPSKEQRKRESSKCNCKAHLRIKLQKYHDIFPMEWRVTSFVAEHNHGLLTESEVRFLPAYRTILEDDCERIFLLKEGGLSVRQIMRVMELEKDVKHGYLPFTEKDVRNLFLKANKKVERSDVWIF